MYVVRCSLARDRYKEDETGVVLAVFAPATTLEKEEVRCGGHVEETEAEKRWERREAQVGE
jgi:hypothetical protein